MVDIDKAIIARFKVKGESFEILVDCDKALEYQEGKNLPFEEVLATKEIYKDVKKGERASKHEVAIIFGTNKAEEAIKRILKEGEIQLTAEHKRKLMEEKRKQIITIISTNAVNPQTGFPHPPQRISSAMDEAKVRINEFKRAEEQVEDILSKLRVLLPIKFEIREIEIIIPADKAAKSYHVLKSYGKLTKEEWISDGSLRAILEIPAGIQEKFEDEINKATHGDNEVKIMKKI